MKVKEAFAGGEKMSRKRKFAQTAVCCLALLLIIILAVVFYCRANPRPAPSARAVGAVSGAAAGQIAENTRADREEFLSETLNLSVSPQGENRYLLTWNETVGDGYEVQRMAEDGVWETVERLEKTAARQYLTETLKSGRTVCYRVAAAGSVPDTAAATAEIRTEISPRYCTVWPVRNLPVSDPQTMEDTGRSVPAGAALCVLEEKDGMFLVWDGEAEGYIDSRYCMINLPEYLGDLCEYDIVNSYGALYRMHGYEIPQVTGTVISGYEKVQLADGQFLVPYLYPCCEKLIAAARAAGEDGWRLKIYDAYRPHLATEQIYQAAGQILDQPLPSGEAAAAASAGNERTYRDLVEMGPYHLSSFLARTGSSHNMGIALDLTLVSDTGEEPAMQTEMHDLSWYSVTDRNTGTADLLRDYMTGAGYHTLVSEWWHFQDNETRDALGLGYFQPGVSIEGWKADDNGRRYQNEDGTFATRSDSE